MTATNTTTNANVTGLTKPVAEGFAADISREHPVAWRASAWTDWTKPDGAHNYRVTVYGADDVPESDKGGDNDYNLMSYAACAAYTKQMRARVTADLKARLAAGV